MQMLSFLSLLNIIVTKIISGTTRAAVTPVRFAYFFIKVIPLF